jgi:hypothetical protein
MRLPAITRAPPTISGTTRFFRISFLPSARPMSADTRSIVAWSIGRADSTTPSTSSFSVRIRRRNAEASPARTSSRPRSNRRPTKFWVSWCAPRSTPSSAPRRVARSSRGFKRTWRTSGRAISAPSRSTSATTAGRAPLRTASP